jgi:UrcA family protein
MMNTLLNTQSIRNTIMAALAVTALALPLVASASAKNIHISYDKSELDTAQGQERLYEQLKSASSDLCELDSLQVIGTLTKNTECYEGTLTAAVQRLDNTAITALHSQ